MNEDGWHMKTGDLTQKKHPRRHRDGSQAVGCAPGGRRPVQIGAGQMLHVRCLQDEAKRGFNITEHNKTLL